jgi:hypothetical protein
MGLGFPSVLLAWRPTGAAALADGIGTLINQPAVLLGAAVVVVVAVLIVLIMVLRGGSKKNELAAEAEEDQGAWDSAPRGAAPSQSGRGYDSRDQMLPWEQGGGRADSGRPSMSGKRGGDAQSGWGQADQGAPQWQGQSPSPSRGGGQWVGTDEWVPPEVGAGRGNADPRGQGQMGARDNEGWPWSANQGPAGGQGGDRDQWGQAAVAPMGRGGDQWGQAAASPMGRGDDQWGQGQASPMGRGDDQWGQGPASNRPMGREQDQWGQAAAPAYGQGRGNDQWGQGPVSTSAPRGDDQWGQGPATHSAPRGDDQWGQGPGASHPMGREQDQWGQAAAPARGRGQDQWGGASSPNGYGAGQPDDQGFEQRGGPRRSAEPAGQADGQWGQGGWGQANAGWGGNEPAGQWGQSAAPSQPPQAARPVQPGNSRPNSQGAPSGFGSPAPAASDAGSGWGEREAPAWQAEPRRETPSWGEAPSWQVSEPEPPSRSAPRNPSGPQPQWEQPGRGAAEAGWESPSAAGSWGQQDPTVRPSPSRPIEPAAPRSVSQPNASGGEWGQDFERPTSKPAPPPSWEQREAPAWASPAGAADAPTARPAPAGGRLSKVSPESTAYAAPAPEVGEGADKTVIIRKDAGAVRAPSVVVRQGKEPGRSYDMRKDHLTIGRSRESDIFLEDLAVSRLHATIYRDEMGGYLLRDENSANGTTVNGQRVTEVALQEGDEIQLGQTILAFVRR